MALKPTAENRLKRSKVPNISFEATPDPMAPLNSNVRAIFAHIAHGMDNTFYGNHLPMMRTKDGIGKRTIHEVIT